MLVTFKTDVGNISMFGDIAMQMIKMMGHSETIPGAILAKDLPQALSRLKTALAKAQNTSPPDENDSDEEGEPPINIMHRAIPLINLMTEAAKTGCDLMWE